MAYPPLQRGGHDVVLDDPIEERARRKRQCALGYRVFGALGWGQTGDGHISARDPELADHFWMLGYGVPFHSATVDDLVLVAPDGSLAAGNGDINETAYYIHGPIHQARPDVVSVAHTHTGYGTPWCANVEPFRPISQEACSFVYTQSIFEGEEVNVDSYATGERLAAAIQSTRLCFLRNHGLLTVGGSVDEAVGFFVMAERVAEVHVKAPNAKAISEEGAKAAAVLGEPSQVGWQVFQWLARSLVPDPSVVD